MKREDNLSARMRHRIAIEEPHITSDGGGGSVVAWEKLQDIWAEVIPTTPAETNLGGQIVQTISFNVTTRYVKGINHNMRVKFSGRYYNIKTVWNEGNKNKITKMVIEYDIFQ